MSDYFLFFLGREPAMSQYPSHSDLGLGASVVLTFADILLRRVSTSYHFFFDNYFTGLPLLNELSKRGCKGTGTIRAHRVANCPLPNNAAFAKEVRGSFVRVQEKKGELCLARWNDGNCVTVASNHLTEFPLQTATRWDARQKCHVDLHQPNSIFVYNKYMGGVDRCDQNVSHYHSSIRGRKWWFPIFTHLVDLSVQNAWLLHRKMADTCGLEKLDHMAFRRHLAQYFCGLYGLESSTAKVPHPLHSCTDTTRYDKYDHTIEYCEKENRCSQCFKNAHFVCRRCMVHLHPKQCFSDFHTPRL
jgi:DNA excision repair protein ERCC-6